eukprot:30822-Pelagococcus_subviridis.AAC.8
MRRPYASSGGAAGELRSKGWVNTLPRAWCAAPSIAPSSSRGFGSLYASWSYARATTSSSLARLSRKRSRSRHFNPFDRSAGRARGGAAPPSANLDARVDLDASDAGSVAIVCIVFRGARATICAWISSEAERLTS